MSCLPGMPCYNSPVVKIVYPPGCDPTPVPVVSSDQVHYDGPNLPCTGVQNGDDLNTVLSKIDNKICSEELVASIIETIANNEILKAYFCQLVGECGSTTTTTTTIPVYSYNIRIAPDFSSPPCDNPIVTIYSLYDSLDTVPGGSITGLGVYVYLDPQLSVPVSDGSYIWREWPGNPGNIQSSSIFNNGQVYGFLGYTSDCTTTTTTSSSSTSTTTTTTTVPSFSFEVYLLGAGQDPCSGDTPTTIYSTSSVLGPGSIVYTDAGLTMPVSNTINVWKVSTLPEFDYMVSSVLAGGELIGFYGTINCP